MDIIQVHRTNRFNLLLALYIASDADPEFSINFQKLGEGKDLTDRQVMKGFQYLLEENFIALKDGGTEHQTAITHKGIKVVEEVFLDDRKQTYYFPPYRDMRTKFSHS